MKKPLCPSEDLTISDSFFCDEKKLTGYTVENNEVVAWDDEKHQHKGFVKYVSHPFWKSTTGDPYDDFDKVTGQVDSSILPEALHPLVAACPKVGVDMEQIILSKNENLSVNKGHSTTHQNTNSVTRNTSNSHHDANNWGVSSSIEGGAGGFKVSVSGNYSHNWSNTVSIKNDTGDTTSDSKTDSWTTSLNINHAESAFLNSNVRYINMGTAPIYNVKPTLNFVLGETKKDMQTIATVSAKRNTVANIIFPERSYPEQPQKPIAFNTNDDFNSHPITLNYEQLEKLNKDKKLKIETTQVSGNCGSFNASNSGLELKYSWEHILPQIQARTASITINFDNGKTIKRRIAARKAENYAQQYQPELTIKEAMELAFPGVVINSKNGNFAYKNLYNYRPNVVLDKTTNQLIAQQLNQQTIDKTEAFDFNLKLMQGMNILIIPQHNDQELFDLVNKFFGNFTSDHRLDLMDFDPSGDWTSVLEYIKQLLKNKFGELAYPRIKNLQLSNLTQKIETDVDKNHNAQKYLTFEVGALKSEKIAINFKNIFTDQVLLEKITNFLQKFNVKNPFSLAMEADTDLPWSHVIQDIKTVVETNFSPHILSRITLWGIENEKDKINLNADEKGQDSHRVWFKIGNKKSSWITMYFENIYIKPIPTKINIDEWKLWTIDIKVSGDTWGRWYMHEDTSKELKLFDIKDYRQKTYQQFIEKYPVVDFKFNSYIEHWSDKMKKDKVNTGKYKTRDLFKEDGSVTTTDISNFYEAKFITGGTQGFTQIITYVRDNQFYIKNTAHAGGGGNSFWGKLETAVIEIKEILFHK